MSRRILGITAVLLMANATFAATATACMMTGGAVVHTTAHRAGAAGHEHHQHHAAATDDASSEAPANAPSNAPHHGQSVPTCCKAVAPCTSVVSVATVVTVPNPAVCAASIAALVESAPESRLVAPDPPPPKA